MNPALDPGEIARSAREFLQSCGLSEPFQFIPLHGGANNRVSRVDAAGRPEILEVNLNPCLAPDAGFVAAAARAGLDYDAVIGSIVTATRGRHRAAA